MQGLDDADCWCSASRAAPRHRDSPVPSQKKLERHGIWMPSSSAWLRIVPAVFT